MKKILIYGLTKNHGGIESFIYNHLKAMDKSGLELHFLVYEAPVFYDEIKEMGGVFHFVKRRGEDLKENRQKTKELFEQYDFDTIWFNVCTLSYIYPLKCAFEAGVPNRIVHVHSPNASGGWKMKLAHNFNKMIFKKYTNVYLSCSEGATEYSFDRDIVENRDYKIIYNAIDIEKFKFNEKSREEIRQELQLNDEFAVGHVGRFSDVKNHDFLLDVFNEITKLDDSARLVLVGGGEKEEEIRNKIDSLNLNEKVKVLGVRNDAHKILSAMDAYVFPSKYEGLSLSMVEAQASGLICFTSTNISEENKVIDQVYFYDLSDSPKNWAKKILDKSKDYPRKDFTQIIGDKGFDINKNVKELKKILL